MNRTMHGDAFKQTVGVCVVCGDESVCGTPSILAQN